MTSSENHQKGDCYTEEAFEQLAFNRLDPAAKSTLLEHAASCSKCKSEIDRVEIETRALTLVLSAVARQAGDDCINDEQLASFVDGGLSETERETVERHLATCATCQEKMVGTYRETRTILRLLEQGGEGPQNAPRSQPKAKTLRWPGSQNAKRETGRIQTEEDTLAAPAPPWKTIAAACAAGATITAAILIPFAAPSLVVFALACITFLYTEIAGKAESQPHTARSFEIFGSRTIFLAGGLVAWALALVFPPVSPILLPAAFTSYLLWLRPSRRLPGLEASSTSTNEPGEEKDQDSTQSNSR